MPNYNPNYDMPPKVDRFINKHPRIAGAIMFCLIVGAMALAGYLENN